MNAGKKLSKVKIIPRRQFDEMCLEAAGDTTGQEFKLPQKQHLSVSMQNILYLHFSQEPPEIIPKSTQREIKPHLTTLREV